MTSLASPRLASSRARAVAYWTTTALVAAELGVGGIWDLLRIPYVRQVVEHLGYPTYFLVILGAWKVPGAVALIAPRSARLKEWAYAGAFFTYTGAVASHLTVGDDVGAWGFPLVFAGLTGASWALRPPARRDLGRR
jgi:DoxX-like protein